jgi:nucleoside 2-deoxyribosyltransferase
MTGLTYLAGPYTHRSVQMRGKRVAALNRVAAKLMRQGVKVFSPISHTHPIAMAGELPTGWNFWREYDEVMLACCDRMLVVTATGWKESKGVAAEIEIAKRLGLPVEYLDRDGEPTQIDRSPNLL